MTVFNLRSKYNPLNGYMEGVVRSGLQILWEYDESSLLPNL